MRTLYGVELKDNKSKRSDANEATDHTAMVNSMRWHSHVLRREREWSYREDRH